MKYSIPILLYFGLKPKEIMKMCPDIKQNSIYHARKQMLDQNTLKTVSDIMMKYNMEKAMKENKKNG